MFWPFMDPEISSPYPQELTTGPSLLPDKFKHHSLSNSTINLLCVWNFLSECLYDAA